MRERPRSRSRPRPCRLQRVEQPGLDDYRALFRLVGAPWLWFSRLVMDDAGWPRSSTTRRSSSMKCSTATAASRHARARLPRGRRVRARLRRPDPRVCRARAMAAGCLPKRSHRPGAMVSAGSTSTPARSIIRRRWPPTAVPASFRTGERSSAFPTRACRHPAGIARLRSPLLGTLARAGRPAS